MSQEVIPQVSAEDLIRFQRADHILPWSWGRWFGSPHGSIHPVGCMLGKQGQLAWVMQQILAGASLKTIRESTGYAQDTVVKARRKFQTLLAQRGAILRCACGRSYDHHGRCQIRRRNAKTGTNSGVVVRMAAPRGHGAGGGTFASAPPHQRSDA